MKKVLFAALIAACSLSSVAAQNAVARKVNGFDIYIYADPVGKYTEVFTISGFWNWGELFTKATIDNTVETMVRNAKKKNAKLAKDGKQQANALVIYSNKKGSAIHLE